MTNIRYDYRVSSRDITYSGLCDLVFSCIYVSKSYIRNDYQYSSLVLSTHIKKSPVRLQLCAIPCNTLPSKYDWTHIYLGSDLWVRVSLSPSLGVVFET